MTIYMTAQWKCRSGAEAKVEAAMRLFASSIYENEPGIKVYTVL